LAYVVKHALDVGVCLRGGWWILIHRLVNGCRVVVVHRGLVALVLVLLLHLQEFVLLHRLVVHVFIVVRLVLVLVLVGRSASSNLVWVHVVVHIEVWFNRLSSSIVLIESASLLL
jgi:hypothetical protein